MSLQKYLLMPNRSGKQPISAIRLFWVSLGSLAYYSGSRWQTQLTSCSSTARISRGTAVKMRLQRVMQISSKIVCPEKPLQKAAMNCGTVNSMFLQKKYKIISLILIQFHLPCTNSNLHNILNSGSAQSLACTAPIPYSPNKPIPICAVFIIGTSFAPSPIAKVILLRYSRTSLTTYAFWIGSNLQQTTALHFQDSNASYLLQVSYLSICPRSVPSIMSAFIRFYCESASTLRALRTCKISCQTCFY